MICEAAGPLGAEPGGTLRCGGQGTNSRAWRTGVRGYGVHVSPDKEKQGGSTGMRDGVWGTWGQAKTSQ